jgi:hypothetical protein
VVNDIPSTQRRETAILAQVIHRVTIPLYSTNVLAPKNIANKKDPALMVMTKTMKVANASMMAFI